MIVIHNVVDQEGEVSFDDVSSYIGTCDTKEECRTLIQTHFDENNEVEEGVDDGYELDWDMFEYDSVRVLVVGSDDDNVMFEGGYVIL